MEINTKNMSANELRKIGLIITHISGLGWDVSGYGQGDANQLSGNVYVWLEDYPVTPYIDLSGDDKVNFLYSCPECGHEWDIEEKDVRAENWPTKCEECGKDL